MGCNGGVMPLLFGPLIQKQQGHKYQFHASGFSKDDDSIESPGRPTFQRKQRRLGQEVCWYFKVNRNLFLPFHFSITLSG